MKLDPDHVADAAVLDVGSNSVRLVVYRLEGRAIWTVYNEKVLAGLGRDLKRTGRLAPDGVVTALAALRRFRALLDAIRPDAIYTAATAAVREARDGLAFAKQVRDATGFELDILTGEDEARFAALGVVAGAPEAGGVAGDLGGYSLELVRIRGREPGDRVTLPLGPFAFGQAKDGAPVRNDDLQKAIARALQPVATTFSSDCFYAVGGAWRNLALLHMQASHYPLEILHQYEISAREARDTAQFIARQSKSSLERMPGVSKKRAETLPHAAAVLDGIIEQLGVRSVQISAYGLREGLLFNAMAAHVRARDPLVEGCAALGARQEIAEDFGAGLEAWLRPVFDTLPPVLDHGRDRVLLAAACRLADLGSRLHPDHRAQLVFEQVLRAPVAGVSHVERAFLARIVFSRHTAAAAAPEPQIIARLLGEEREQRAKAIGAAIRLGCDLSGRSRALLESASLSLDDGALVLGAVSASADIMLGELTTRRAQTLAAALERDLRIERD